MTQDRSAVRTHDAGRAGVQPYLFLNAVSDRFSAEIVDPIFLLSLVHSRLTPVSESEQVQAHYALESQKTLCEVGSQPSDGRYTAGASYRLTRTIRWRIPMSSTRVSTISQTCLSTPSGLHLRLRSAWPVTRPSQRLGLICELLDMRAVRQQSLVDGSQVSIDRSGEYAAAGYDVCSATRALIGPIRSRYTLEPRPILEVGAANSMSLQRTSVYRS